ncbi:hypothetical protein PDESU_00093 [Pontiella desulfatans]|uniref:Uncharacterized protein n=1 Tax=Pontiella desulfatans TaxID=2750659 RepID=A0A6C2TVA4_PONDE|nr:hypothetical protein [Pontiella desulfatans]VGO11548.1 hypothetical protein PDESU_00093 [Pontiella desulfatans]
MKSIQSILICSVLLASGWAVAEMHAFKLPDGRSVEAEIMDYNAKLGQVELQLANGSRKKIDPTIFVQADQDYIKEWASLDGFRSSSQFKIECAKKKLEQWKEGDDAFETKFEKYVYEVSLANRTASEIDPLKVEYRIYYEQEENDMATKKVVNHQQVKSGTLDVERVRAKETRRANTEPVVLKEFEFNMSDYYVEGGDPESTSGELKGIWVRLTVKTKSGQTAVRDVYEPDSIKGKYAW